MGSFLPLIFTTKVVQTIHTNHFHHHSRTGPEAESDMAEAYFLLQKRWVNYWQSFQTARCSTFTFELPACIFSHFTHYLPSETRDKSSNHLSCDLNCPGGCKHAAFSCSGKTHCLNIGQLFLPSPTPTVQGMSCSFLQSHLSLP